MRSHFECALSLSVLSFLECPYFERARILTVSQDPTRVLLDLIPRSAPPTLRRVFA